MCVYYFIFLRLIRHRTLKFSPKIVTSQKAHGKWGDFIICFVPISGCANILSNSNFIMRMLEGQTESSLFTVRIRGRQWYGVYKIELKDMLKAQQTSKNVGHNYGESYENVDAAHQMQKLNSFQIRNHNKEYLAAYKQNVSNLNARNDNYVSTAGVTSFVKQHATLTKPSFFVDAPKPADLTPRVDNLNARLKADYFNVGYNVKPKILGKNSDLYPQITHSAINVNKRFARAANFKLLDYLNVNRSDNLTVFSGRGLPNAIEPKTTADNLYFVIKQKRFAAPIKKIASINVKKRESFLKLNAFSLLDQDVEHSYSRKGTAKRLKYKSGTIPLAYSKRLLRTRRVLVLPSQVNITLITNSFDVVHSWYIPGLGVKLDCIPGRSTHHTIFIDHAGFYYGQCAEICGRYHHHMPIRVCALPFEHFLIGGYHYGLPYFNATNTDRKTSVKSGIRQYSG